jgi:predicted site-specific integrase-resolvase
VPDPKLVTTAVAARALGVAGSTLWRWQKAGHVTPAFTTMGGQARWDVDDLRRQIAAWRERQNDELDG